LLIGTSGAGKSSLINYLAGETLAKVGDTGNACTDKSESFKVTLANKKLNIIDTQGFNDTNGFIIGNGQVASRIRF
jgi:predicted GTPase